MNSEARNTGGLDKIQMTRFLKFTVLYFFVFLKKRKRRKRNGDFSAFDFNDKKTAVICSAGIGDALMATPLIFNAYKLNGKRKIDLISYARVKEIFRYNKYIDKVFLFDKRKFFESLSFFLRIRKTKYDLIFCAQPANTLFDAILSSSAGCSVKIDKINKNKLEEKINSLYDFIIPNSFSRHRVELNLDMVRKLGAEIEENVSKIDFFSSEDVASSAKDKLDGITGRKYICIHPGSGGAYKRWNAENFIELIRQINGFSDDPIVLLGGKDEIDLCKIIEEENKGILNMCGRLTLFETSFVLSNSRMLICNDTGIMHLATANKIPVIALFGPTNPLHIGPYTKNSFVIKNSEKMESITVQDVIEKYKTMGKN